MADEDKKKTSLVASGGLLKLSVKPFGFSNASGSVCEDDGHCHARLSVDD